MKRQKIGAEESGKENLCLAFEHLVSLLSTCMGRSCVSSEFFRSPIIVYKEACEENQAILERSRVQPRVCLTKQM